MYGEVADWLFEKDNLYLFGDFGCHSSSAITCEGACTRLGPSCFELTKDDPHTNGYFWTKKKLNVSLPFSVEVTINVGKKDEGGEGLVFVLQDESMSTVGGIGEGMGFQGISPSFGIAFDTNYNYPDMTQKDHISFHMNGFKNKLCNRRVDLSNIEDDSDHKVIIIWDPSSEHMAVFFDNESSTPTLQMDVHLSNTFGSGETFRGFTAGTGEKSNEQTVCITEVKIGNENVPLLDPNNGMNCDKAQELKC